jgi:phosphotransferase system  glucose/maltose/N-acetylglucosamine-specific IIC component
MSRSSSAGGVIAFFVFAALAVIGTAAVRLPEWRGSVSQLRHVPLIGLLVACAIAIVATVVHAALG